MDMQCIARRLRALRGSRSVEEVAISVGISAYALSQYEAGLRMPRDEVKLWLSQYYGMTLQNLFFDSREHES